MYVAHAFLKQPADDARLWRYMTPTTFLSMVLGRSLFFSSLSRFEDPFEGVPPRAVIEAMRQRRDGRLPEDSHRLDAWKNMIQLCRATVFASCWHVGDEESEAMWKLYGRFEDGLAIVTTLGSIKRAFENEDVTGALVDYSGREFEAGTTDENLLQWATTKRPSYKHENEFRLLARRQHSGAGDDDKAGVELPIDPRVLIEEVVLSPRMERWQADLFRGLLRTLEFDRPLRESSLLMPPL
jgi:hypothetical protein